MSADTCKNYMHYAAYYKQSSIGYVKMNHGYCSKYKKPQVQFENCESFKGNERIETNREKRRLRFLDEALTSITEIAQIMKEKENGI